MYMAGFCCAETGAVCVCVCVCVGGGGGVYMAHFCCTETGDVCVDMAGFHCAETGEVLPAPGPGLCQCPGRHEVWQAAAGEVLPCRLFWTGGSLFCVTFGQVGLSSASPLDRWVSLLCHLWTGGSLSVSPLDRWVSLLCHLWTGGSLFRVTFGQVGLSSASPFLDRWVSFPHDLLWTGGSLFHIVLFGQVGLFSLLQFCSVQLQLQILVRGGKNTQTDYIT